MFSRTNKTNFKLDLDYHNNNILYFPSDKHLYIYKQLYNKYTTIALKKRLSEPHTQINNSVVCGQDRTFNNSVVCGQDRTFNNSVVCGQDRTFYTTIQTNATREYNKLFKSDYATNSDYINYSNAYDFKIKHALSIEAFNEMLNNACNKLYETIRTNTKTLIVNCDAYLAKLFYIQKQIENNKHKRTNEEETDHKQTYIEIPTYKSIVDDLNIRFYTYNAPRNMQLLQKLCKNRCVNKLNKYKRLIADFIKIVYVKVVVYNKQFKLAIEMVLKSKIYNFGLGLKLSMRDCGIELS